MPRNTRDQTRASQGEPSVPGGSLPVWEVRDSVKLVPGWLLIECPRASCRRQAIVDPDWPVGGFPTRPCGYCFRAARIPGRDTVEAPRRVVRRVKSKRRTK